MADTGQGGLLFPGEKAYAELGVVGKRKGVGHPTPRKSAKDGAPPLRTMPPAQSINLDTGDIMLSIQIRVKPCPPAWVAGMK